MLMMSCSSGDAHCDVWFRECGVKALHFLRVTSEGFAFVKDSTRPLPQAVVTQFKNRLDLVTHVSGSVLSRISS